MKKEKRKKNEALVKLVWLVLDKQ